VPWLRLRSHVHSPRERIAVYRKGHILSCLPGSIAGPVPIIGYRHEAAANRIGVNVTDLLTDIFRRSEISVIPSTPLPEPIMRLSVRLSILHTTEKIRSIGTNPQNSPFGHRGLHGCQNPANPNPRTWKNHHVYVFRHEHITEETIEVRGSTRIEGLRQPSAASRARQKRLPPETGERQTVCLPLDVVAFACFAVVCVHSLADMLTRA